MLEHPLLLPFSCVAHIRLFTREQQFGNLDRRLTFMSLVIRQIASCDRRLATGDAHRKKLRNGKM